MCSSLDLMLTLSKTTSPQKLLRLIASVRTESLSDQLEKGRKSYSNSTFTAWNKQSIVYKSIVRRTGPLFPLIVPLPRPEAC